MASHRFAWSLLLVSLLVRFAIAEEPAFLSHAPIRALPKPSTRPLAEGPAFFVSPDGDDANPGTKDKPWRSINAALPKLSPGDTLYLRGGEYFENVYCAIAGTTDKPITIRSYQGELATIDGGMPEFQTDPANAWEPFTDGGAADEYVSTKSYKNIRDVVGLFGDSNLGLQTYWYLMDMRAENERWIPNKQTMIDPMYIGPGIFYDKQTGKIHARFAHTKLEAPGSNVKIEHYEGETDPQKMPLVIAPFKSKPLMVDQAMYVHFQDLVFRGGGLITVHLSFGVGIEFDRCTIYASTYGILSRNTGPLKITNTAVRGMFPPWSWRDENCLYSYTGSVYPPFVDASIPADPKAATESGTRNISRLPTHALLVTEGGLEHEVYYYPVNHDWEIANCEFTDSHDGVYPTGRDIKFHHNWVDNMNDDGIYMSSPTPYMSDRVQIYQNVISSVTTALATHARGGPGGDIYVYRNVVDLRNPVHFERPSVKHPSGNLLRGGCVFLMHDAAHVLHVEQIHFYQNTFLFRPLSETMFAGNMLSGRDPETNRSIFNNAFLMYDLKGNYPTPQWPDASKADVQIDGNLYWQIEGGKPEDIATDFKAFRDNPLAVQNRSKYPAGLTANDVSADPKMKSLVSDPYVTNDYRLSPQSPAIGAGVPLPAGYPDAFRSTGRPDIGAIPAGGEQLYVGIDSRIPAGTLIDPQK